MRPSGVPARLLDPEVIANFSSLGFGVRPLDPPIRLRDTASLTAAMNAYLRDLGWRELEPDWLRAHGWRELDANDAVRVLTYLQSESLAYHMPIEPLSVARHNAQAFVALFGPQCRFFSNNSLHGVLLPDGTRPRNAPWSWGPSFVGATFEAGIFAVDVDRIGHYWATDED